MEMGWAEADATEHAVDYSNVASSKMTPQEPKKAKEALFYPSSRIWRRWELIGNTRYMYIDHR